MSAFNKCCDMRATLSSSFALAAFAVATALVVALVVVVVVGTLLLNMSPCPFA